MMTGSKKELYIASRNTNRHWKSTDLPNNSSPRPGLERGSFSKNSHIFTVNFKSFSLSDGAINFMTVENKRTPKLAQNVHLPHVIGQLNQV
jgi:hypothetical protein